MTPKKIIVHCSDSDHSTHDDIEVVREWHLDKGWDDIGYHFFIRQDGIVQIGRDMDDMGAHCFAQNRESLGICVAGRHYFTLAQKIALRGLIRVLRIKFNIKESEVYPHKHFDSRKTCPNFDLEEFLKEGR